MKLLLIQGGFGAGGAEKNVAMIAAHRAACGDEVHVAGMANGGSGSYFPYPDAVTLHLHPNHGKGARSMTQLRRLKQIVQMIQEVQPDLILSFLTKVNTLTLVATLGRTVPVVISERNNPRAQNAHPIWRAAQNLLARRAASIVMQTQRASQDLPAGLQKRVRVIANPCEPFEGIEDRLGRGGRNLVAVGRLDRQKGFDLLISAMPKILKQVPDIRLTIFGEGPERQALEQQRDKLELSETVSLPGATPAPGDWMTGADILVVPSRFEGFPNVIAEATVSGLPVVAFDCAFGPRELIRHEENGLLVPPGDVRKLAEAVVELSTNAEMRARMRRAVAFNRDWLAPERILAEWDGVIEQAISRIEVCKRSIREDARR